MNPEDVVEAFVSTIMIGVMIVVMVYLLNPEIGQNLIGILPTFVETMVYFLIGAILLAMIFQLVDQF